MIYQTLINVDTLNAHLNTPNWVVVDCRFSLADIEAGYRAYRDGHIPGARYAHLDNDLSGPITPLTGRHPLPDPTLLTDALGRWEIGDETQVVAYDDMGGMLAAARLWWLLRWLGHQAVAVLDGGFSAWRRAGLPLSTEEPAVQTVVFNGRPNQQLWLTTEQMENLSAEALLLDGRAAARYRGEVEPIDPVAGHIPGAINAPIEENLTAEGYFRPLSELQARFSKVLSGHPPTAVVHSCGSGVTACHNLLAMEAAGFPGSRLYAGSWSEWIRDPNRPIATETV